MSHLFTSHRLIRIGLIISILAVTFALAGCAPAPGAKGATGPPGPVGPAGPAGPPIELMVTPSVAKVNQTVMILGSGFTPGQDIEIKMSYPLGGIKGLELSITRGLSPPPKVNDFGAFATSLKLNKFESGVYTVKALDKEGRLLATAPLQVEKK